MIKKEFGLNEVFTLSEIIDKMGLEADIDKITNTVKTSKLETKKDATALGKEVVLSLGIDVMTKLIRNLHKAKKEVIALISNMTELSPEEVSKMGIKQMKEFFTELFSDTEVLSFLSNSEADEKK